jgi:hypothetical protein
MASERSAAKASIQETEYTDPELSGALGAANQFQIALVKEQNRHVEAQTNAHLGWFGRLLGGESTAPTVIAAIAALLGFVFAGACLYLAATDTGNNQFYSEWSTRAFAITTTALGFIFGKKLK